ncbi:MULTISPECIES: hypothetical protein [Flammeovirga]|uniref:Uncharacterized protein n=1 Tax=Flammeovirga agarivorans TaxID=2726742 RepID=A0A7X8XW13_9BACT|nr:MULTISPECIES: hypothetical protein [Flammeovirga]NLR91774.1 hypothetical protein [Flammeovirga agarivorans]
MTQQQKTRMIGAMIIADINIENPSHWVIMDLAVKDYSNGETADSSTFIRDFLAHVILAIFRLENQHFLKDEERVAFVNTLNDNSTTLKEVGALTDALHHAIHKD